MVVYSVRVKPVWENNIHSHVDSGRRTQTNTATYCNKGRQQKAKMQFFSLQNKTCQRLPMLFVLGQDPIEREKSRGLRPFVLTSSVDEWLVTRLLWQFVLRA